MAEKFVITAPDGFDYEVEAPAGTTEEQALQHFQQNWKPQGSEAIVPTTEQPVRPDWTKTKAPKYAGGATYGFGEAAASGASLGLLYPQLPAAVQAAKQGFAPGVYEQAKTHYNLAREKFTQENPFLAPATEIGASLPATVSGVGLMDKALRATPYALPFLTGRAGYGAAGEALPGASQKALRFASQGTAGAIQGAEAGALTSELSPGTSTAEDLKLGAAFGGPAGAVAGTSTNALLNWVKGPVISEERARLAQAMLDAGIDIRGPHILNGAPFNPRQQQAYAAAAAGTFRGKDLSRKSLVQEHKRIKTELDDVAKQTGVRADQDMLDNLADIEQRISLDPGVGKTAERKMREMINLIRERSGATVDPFTGTWIPNLANMAPTNTGNALLPYGQRAWVTGTPGMSGEHYQSLTKWSSPLSRASRRGKDTAPYAIEIRDTLDAALERTAGPAGGAAVRDARMQYKNWLVVRDALRRRSGSTSIPEGELDPRNLLPATNKFYRDRDISGTPGSRLNELAEGGTEFFSGPEHASKVMPFFSKETASKVYRDMLYMFGPGGVAYATGQHPYAVGLATLPGAAIAADQFWRNTPRYARGLIRRAQEARAVPSGLQPGLNKLTRATIPAGAETFSRIEEEPR